MSWYKKSDENKVRVRLPKEISGWLSRQPESGMGYQRVDFIFSDSSSQTDCIVLNGEETELPESFKDKKSEPPLPKVRGFLFDFTCSKS